MIQKFIIKSNPFGEINDPQLVLDLLHATATKPPTKQAQAKYHKTQHWANLVQAATELYKTCAICGKGKNLTVHHRGYARLFCEHLTEDVVLVCQRCHRKLHGKG